MVLYFKHQRQPVCTLEQPSPTFLAPQTGFMEDGRGWVEWGVA